MKSTTMPFSVFLSRSLSRYGDVFDYVESEYQKATSVITIRCKVCDHTFKRQASHHLTKTKCPNCQKIEKASNLYMGRVVNYNTIYEDEFKQKIAEKHGDRFNLANVEYKGWHTKTTFTCAEHGEFKITPLKLYKSEHGCQKCAKEFVRQAKVKSTKQFIDESVATHGHKYDYSELEYVNDSSKIVLRCIEHDFSFSQQAGSHLVGCEGCPKCHKFGSAENEVREFVKSLGFETIKDRTVLEGKEIDIYVPEKKVGIEYNGLYWHSDAVLNNAINVHKYKTDLAATKGIRLLHLFEDDWKNKRGLVERYIKQALGVIDKRIYARKCDVVELTSKDANAFLTTNHIQGKSASQIHYGLMYNGDLVAVMQFSNNTSNRGIIAKGVYELTRYATSCSIVGGASKLFTRFVNDHKPTEVFSFSDRSWFSGGMYEKLGFVKVSESGPDYKVIDNDIRKHKSLFKRVNLAARFGDRFDPSLSERDNCHKLGLYRIYDCGKIKWSYTNSIKEQ